MAQFDVYRLRDGAIVVDCQSDLLSGLQSRFVVPLLPVSARFLGSVRLNPLLRIDGADYMLVPQGATSLLTRELGAPLSSAADYDFTIIGAIDVLTGGV